MTQIPDRIKITIKDAELIELKQHAHFIPECPGLEKRIQKYKGDKPFVFTFDELEWVVSVLEAVLTDPQGYACIDFDPWKLEYVPASDKRCQTCRKLYKRLKAEVNKIWELR